jgi:hypothetical protein
VAISIYVILRSIYSLRPIKKVVLAFKLCPVKHVVLDRAPPENVVGLRSYLLRPQPPIQLSAF